MNAAAHQLHAMQVLLKQAKEARDEAARRVADALIWRDNSQQKLQMLHRYRGDYLLRMQAGFSKVATTTPLTQHGAFVDKLEEAIGQQADDAQFRERALDACREQLLQAEKRIRSLEAYIEKQLRALATKEQRREQKAMDEFAAQAARRSVHQHN